MKDVLRFIFSYPVIYPVPIRLLILMLYKGKGNRGHSIGMRGRVVGVNSDYMPMGSAFSNAWVLDGT